MSMSARLTELRVKKGKSLQEVADVVGVSKTHVWQMEKGRSDNPSIDLLKKLSEYFSVPIQFLMGMDETLTVDDIEAQQFLHDFRTLSEEERRILIQTLQLFKSNRTVASSASADEVAPPRTNKLSA